MMRHLHPLRRCTLAIAVLSGLVLSLDSHAIGPNTQTFPYGTQWKGNHYGPTSPWWSTGITLGAKPARFTTADGTPSQFMYGLEGRYHMGPRLAVVGGVHLAKHTVSKEDSLKWMNIEYSYTSDFKYQEASWQLGLDFGLWETRGAHLQAGPRIGVQGMKMELEAELESNDGSEESQNEVQDLLEDNLNTGKTSAHDPFVGGTARLGVFVTPWIEVGLHAQYEVIFGIGDSDVGYSPGTGNGMEFGGYSVMHF